MKYTPSQVRQAVGLPQETLRHWRAQLSFLQDVRGQGPVYRASQVLALAIVKRLVQACGVAVGTLKAVDEGLYRALSGSHWSLLEGACLCIDLPAGRVFVVEGRTAPLGENPLVALPLGPVIAELRVQLTGLEVLDPQQSFAFPPLEVAAPEKARA